MEQNIYVVGVGPYIGRDILSVVVMAVRLNLKYCWYGIKPS